MKSFKLSNPTYRNETRLVLQGTVAYVPQQAWIQHATLKDNVLFGRPLNQHVYEQCLEDCALQADLDILPAGDNTEIGEKVSWWFICC